ncbi:NLP1 protein [Nymphaea thermarum]|nr:NLP1 protein [Nymphaea thermarum]
MGDPSSPLGSSFGPLLDFDFELFSDDMLVGPGASALFQASDYPESLGHPSGVSNPLAFGGFSLFSPTSEAVSVANGVLGDQREFNLPLLENETLPSSSNGYPIELGGSADQNWRSVVVEESGMFGHAAAPSNSIERTRYSSDRVSSIKQRLLQALRNIKDKSSDGDVLVQIWVPVKNRDALVLTTCGQPFALNPSSRRLMDYRTISAEFFFSAESGTKLAVGLPGRVFLGQLPEWTPDVQYYSSSEFPRVDHASRFDVHGTLAVPVFEQGCPSCLGVVEVAMTTQKINFSPEIDKICEALQAVNLRSSDVLSTPFVKVSTFESDVVCKAGYEATIPEILEILEEACETHKLPLALTWMPCIQQGKIGSRHSDDNYTTCISTIDAACYATDNFRGFQEACSEHHLMKGEGMVGMAFTTNQPCFSADVTKMSKGDYPLVHYARFFGLRAAVAIRLRCIYTEDVDYAFEFFLPVNCIDAEEQKMILNSLSLTVQKVCRSLRVVTDAELESESRMEACGTDMLASHTIKKVDTEEPFSLEVAGTNQSSGLRRTSTNDVPQTRMEGKAAEHPAYIPLEAHHRENEISVTVSSPNASGLGLHEGKVHEKRRFKAEKSINLEVLRQYFAGSLKDAAKSLGVCPTTLKRICRQYGITRWPSRKLKKVDHSIKKLQVVIDSVQAVSGNFKIRSFYDSLPKAHDSPVTNKSSSSSGKLSSMNPLTQQASSAKAANISIFQVMSKSTSSCSEGSSSGHSCSSCAVPQLHAATVGIAKDTYITENVDAITKRPYSELVLSNVVSEEEKLIRSHSQKCVAEQPLADSHYSLPESGMVYARHCLVKVLFGEEIMRFRIQPTILFQDLREEIVRRFHVENVGSIDLKYLDDDSEWVLLTCDDDLRECIDIYRATNARMIKLSLHKS